MAHWVERHLPWCLATWVCSLGHNRWRRDKLLRVVLYTVLRHAAPLPHAHQYRQKQMLCHRDVREPHTKEQYLQPHHTVTFHFACTQPRSAVSCSLQNKTLICIVLREASLKCCPQLKVLPWLCTSPCVYRQKQLICNSSCWLLAHTFVTPLQRCSVLPAKAVDRSKVEGWRSQVTRPGLGRCCAPSGPAFSPSLPTKAF